MQLRSIKDRLSNVIGRIRIRMRKLAKIFMEGMTAIAVAEISVCGTYGIRYNRPPEPPVPDSGNLHHIRIFGDRLFSVAYAAHTQLLEVHFKDGVCRRYASVPEHLYDALVHRTKPDLLFSRYIEGRYPEPQ